MGDIKEGYDRVSDILKIFSDFDSIPPEILERKANIGTRVHSAIAEYILLGTGEEFLEESDLGYFNSWKLWYHEGEEKLIRFSETRLYDDRKMYTGAIDGVWSDEGGARNYLIDWKTSAKENPLVWPLQAALYQELLFKSKLCELEDIAFFLKLDKNGGAPELIQYEITEHTIQVAMWALKRYKQEKRLLETVF